ncbi:polysaccharide deacetylase family protein [Halobacteriaceae archaeon GCM10025711]
MVRQHAASVRNALGFDLEHWHSATLLDDAVDDPVDRVEDSVAIVLDLLRRYDVHATFFVVGELADEYPDLVRRIAAEGHELASHGHTHTPLFDLTPDEFRDELRRSAAAIRRATGVEPDGFRAPNFSVTPQTEWAFPILQSRGFRYDSSVFPVETPMYGVSGAPTFPYRVCLDEPFRTTTRDEEPTELVEVPVSVVGSRLRLPIAGGFYARVLPASVLEYGIERLNRQGTPANLYFHPWEFNPAVRVDTPSIHRRFVSFHGIERTERKLERLLASFPFGTVRDALQADGAGEPSTRRATPEDTDYGP